LLLLLLSLLKIHVARLIAMAGL
ncbi:MAG: hypothetical protein EZS28_026930, partial [Streblomastix strix]